MLALKFVDDDRFLASCIADCVEFWRALADGSRCIIEGAGLLPPRSFPAVKVETTGEETKGGGLAFDAFVFVLELEPVSEDGILAAALHSPFSSGPVHC